MSLTSLKLRKNFFFDIKITFLFNLDSTSRTIFTRHRHQSLLDLGLLVLILLEDGFCLEETLLIYAES